MADFSTVFEDLAQLQSASVLEGDYALKARAAFRHGGGGEAKRS
jgi:hypothetical protein